MTAGALATDRGKWSRPAIRMRDMILVVWRIEILSIPASVGCSDPIGSASGQGVVTVEEGLQWKDYVGPYPTRAWPCWEVV
jgi:hypothetical protein